MTNSVYYTTRKSPSILSDMKLSIFATTFAHDDVIKWKRFPRNWPFVRGIHRSPVNSPHKGLWRGALMFSLICAWIKVWINNREAGDFRRHRAHYDVTVMTIGFTWCALRPSRNMMTKTSLCEVPQSHRRRLKTHEGTLGQFITVSSYTNTMPWRIITIFTIALKSEIHQNHWDVLHGYHIKIIRGIL